MGVNSHTLWLCVLFETVSLRVQHCVHNSNDVRNLATTVERQLKQTQNRVAQSLVNSLQLFELSLVWRPREALKGCQLVAPMCDESCQDHLFLQSRWSPNELQRRIKGSVSKLAAISRP
mmetsp:Transcript_26836/g.43205  ORF Transcript_26836/g.43205 Transcript_26836/m.43205 type:complete len:119 (+) Transcript_26836:414-770(+)